MRQTPHTKFFLLFIAAVSEDSVSTRVGHMIKTKVNWQLLSDLLVCSFGNGEKICFCMFLTVTQNSPSAKLQVSSI